ncbi:PAS domain-containing protein [Actinomycetes bacterium KLBMP 9797]
MAHVELSLSDAFVPQPGTTVEPEYGDSVGLWAPTVAAAAEPCLLIDADMSIVAVSDSCCQLLGLGDADDAIGRSLVGGVLRLVDFTQARGDLSDIEIVKIPPLLALSSGRLARGLLRVVAGASADGGVATVDAIATPLFDAGAVAGSLTFFCEV